MLRVTLDTNILISGSFWTGDSFRILDEIDKKNVICILSKEILDEYEKTVKSDEIIDKIKNKFLILSKIAQKVIIDSEIMQSKIKLDIAKDDPDDNKIIECAVAGKADFIITNDNHLLRLKEFEGIKIVTPKEFLRQIKSAGGG